MGKSNGAFIEYSSHAAAELAIAATGKINIAGQTCFVSWVRAPKRGDDNATKFTPNDSTLTGEGTVNSLTSSDPLPPPGPLPLPLPPPGKVSISSVPSGFRPSSEVTKRLSLPKAGGSVIKRPKVLAAPRPSSKPYYPSQNPARLGSRTV